MGGYAQKILEYPDALRKNLDRLLSQRETLYQRAASVTTGYGPRAGHTGFGRRDDTLIALGDLDTEIDEQKKSIAEAERDVDRLLCEIDKIPGWKAMRSAALLRFLYRDRVSWKDVWSAMEESGWNPPATAAAQKSWLKTALTIADAACQSVSDIKEA